eukprot:gene6707-6928_t
MCSDVVTVLAALTELTYLKLDMCSKQQLSALKQLHKLKELHLPAALHSPAAPLQLGQLTALSRVEFVDISAIGGGAGLLVLEAGDELPPNLQELTLSQCSSTQALRELTGLTRLHIAACKSVSTLTDVLHIPSLDSLSLIGAYDSSAEAIEASAAALLIDLSSAAVNLRSLFLGHLDERLLFGAVAHVVRQLTGLTQLSMSGGPESEYDDVEALAHAQALQPLLGAAAGLPQLQDLTLLYFELRHSASTVLATSVSSHLTRLTVSDAQLTDFCLSVICCGLPQLCYLDVQGNDFLTLEALLPFMQKHMPHLRVLLVDETVTGRLSTPGLELYCRMGGC